MQAVDTDLRNTRAPHDDYGWWTDSNSELAQAVDDPSEEHGEIRTRALDPNGKLLKFFLDRVPDREVVVFAFETRRNLGKRPVEKRTILYRERLALREFPANVTNRFFQLLPRCHRP